MYKKYLIDVFIRPTCQQSHDFFYEKYKKHNPEIYVCMFSKRKHQDKELQQYPARWVGWVGERELETGELSLRDGFTNNSVVTSLTSLTFLISPPILEKNPSWLYADDKHYDSDKEYAHWPRYREGIN